MTVAELIDALSKLPQDLPVGILDADTTWTLAVETVSMDEGVVFISGSYGNEL